jgi:hypothetical protein
MISTAIFTVCTKNFIPNAIVALNSAKENIKNYENIKLYCFVIDSQLKEFTAHNCEIKNFFEIFNIEKNITQDQLRWSSKPKILKLLLKNFDVVLYIDPDIFFVGEANDIVFETLLKGILLTKHNRPIYPSNNVFYFNQFKALFSEGFFNAGFVGCCKKGLKAIDWWESMVNWKCCKDKQLGMYDDQKYLDILALEFNDLVNISKNLGYNIAHWTINISDLNPIFYHFSGGKDMQKINKKLFSAYTVYNSKVEKIRKLINA